MREIYKEKMTHIETKHKLKEIPLVDEFERILDACTLSEINKQILRMYYIQEKDFGYIADELGFSIDTVKQRHRKALKKISNVI